MRIVKPPPSLKRKVLAGVVPHVPVAVVMVSVPKVPVAALHARVWVRTGPPEFSFKLQLKKYVLPVVL